MFQTNNLFEGQELDYKAVVYVSNVKSMAFFRKECFIPG